jgi:hypothetical protein
MSTAPQKGSRKKQLTDVSDQLLHFRVGSDSYQQLELRIRSPTPQKCNQARQNDGAHWIDPPSQLASTHRRQNTKTIDKKVVSMVLPQDSDL